MRHRVESGPEIGLWVADQLGRGYFAERSNAVGLRRGQEIVAGVIFENWNRRSIVVHIAATGRMTPTFIAAIFDYAYVVCGVEKVIVTIEDTNAKSIGICEAMGFTKEATITDSHPGGDQFVYTLRKSECRFLDKRYARRISQAHAPSYNHIST